MKLIAALIFGHALALGASSTYAAPPSPMKSTDVRMFASLYNVYPQGDRLVEEPKPLVKNELKLSLRIWAVNYNDECDSENFNPSCKGSTLYITVEDTERLGGPLYGVTLGPAYKFEVQEIEQREGDAPCIALKISERELIKTAKGPAWRYVPRRFCISPTGLAEQGK